MLTETQKKNIKEEKERQKRMVVKVFWQDAEDTGESDVMAGRTWRTHHDPETLHSYDSDEVNINVSKDGAVSFFNDSAESFIYFYPDQLKYLEKALKQAKKQL